MTRKYVWCCRYGCQDLRSQRQCRKLRAFLPSLLSSVCPLSGGCHAQKSPGAQAVVPLGAGCMSKQPPPRELQKERADTFGTQMTGSSRMVRVRNQMGGKRLFCPQTIICPRTGYSCGSSAVKKSTPPVARRIPHRLHSPGRRHGRRGCPPDSTDPVGSLNK